MAKYIVKIFILPKPDVLDPQGKAVTSALNSIGFHEVKDSRIGKYIELTMEKANKEILHEQVKEMCNKLLANTVIEDYSFEVIE